MKYNTLSDKEKHDCDLIISVLNQVYSMSKNEMESWREIELERVSALHNDAKQDCLITLYVLNVVLGYPDSFPN